MNHWISLGRFPPTRPSRARGRPFGLTSTAPPSTTQAFIRCPFPPPTVLITGRSRRSAEAMMHCKCPPSFPTWLAAFPPILNARHLVLPSRRLHRLPFFTPYDHPVPRFFALSSVDWHQHHACLPFSGGPSSRYVVPGLSGSVAHPIDHKMTVALSSMHGPLVSHHDRHRAPSEPV